MPHYVTRAWRGYKRFLSDGSMLHETTLKGRPALGILSLVLWHLGAVWFVGAFVYGIVTGQGAWVAASMLGSLVIIIGSIVSLCSWSVR